MCITVGKEMGIDATVPLLQVDASNAASLQNMVEKTKVVLTTVGNNNALSMSNIFSSSSSISFLNSAFCSSTLINK
jgi:hypothetical protein